jgi:hypothetical protein
MRYNKNKSIVQQFTMMITCPYDQKQRKTEIDYIDSDVSECELCGEHGHVDIHVKCSCGSKHTIELKDW